MVFFSELFLRTMEQAEGRIDRPIYMAEHRLMTDRQGDSGGHISEEEVQRTGFCGRLESLLEPYGVITGVLYHFCTISRGTKVAAEKVVQTASNVPH